MFQYKRQIKILQTLLNIIKIFYHFVYNRLSYIFVFPLSSFYHVGFSFLLLSKRQEASKTVREGSPQRKFQPNK